ncbi:hypothetical protein [Leptolyngbya sp. FACHB-261]|uniref:hypothetical protein n=1 Tax=Leptolyngbya sp. FACHB-261 TaxID=2692806 RepID=UPI001686E6DB|nr:hypothetical protein [Leptolyngbya sp. FACHB-261]MBD2100658.1 hypothetical protein [Leptolyngbya sp. FACHB-261]
MNNNFNWRVLACQMLYANLEEVVARILVTLELPTEPTLAQLDEKLLEWLMFLIRQGHVNSTAQCYAMYFTARAVLMAKQEMQN